MSANMCEIIECPICYVDINPGKNCVTTECGHTFHTNCLMKNVVFNGFGCPFCRTEMVEDVEDNEDDIGSDEEDEDIDSDEEDGEDEEDDDGSDLEDFVVPDDDYDVHRLNDNEEKIQLPSFELIQKIFLEKGVTYENLIKSYMYYSLHMDLDNDIYESCVNSSDGIWEILENVIDNHNSEQEEQVNSVKEYNFFFLEEEYKERKTSNALETSIINSLSLDDIDEDNDDFDYDNFVANILNEINVNNNNYLLC